jgi:tetratricopeptide (TPR) repeat protein
LADAYRYTPDRAAKAQDAYQTAIQRVEQQLAFDPDNAQLLADLAAYEAKTGNRDRALDAIGRAMRFARGNRRVSFQAALVYELGGKRDRALAALRDAVRGGYSLDEIDREPDLARLRQDQRYKQLIESQSTQNLRR